MILYINTTGNDQIEAVLKKDGCIFASKKISAPRAQAEKLLPLIDELIKKNKLKLADIKQIEVENKGGSFTSLRIGVATANALAYALNIPVCGTDGLLVSKNGLNIVKPAYDREPNITQENK